MRSPYFSMLAVLAALAGLTGLTHFSGLAEPDSAQAAETARLESFGPLLDAESVESLARLTVSAVSLGAEEGQGMAVINDKIMRPGDALGLIKLVYLGPDMLVFAFNSKHYVLNPSKRRDREGAEALP